MAAAAVTTRYVGLAADKPPGCPPMPGAALMLEAVWGVGQPVTCLAALRVPAIADALHSAAAAHEGDGGGEDAGAAAAGPAPDDAPVAAVLVGTAGGGLQLISAERLATLGARGGGGGGSGGGSGGGGSSGGAGELGRALLGAVWSLRAFEEGVAAAAFSQVRCSVWPRCGCGVVQHHESCDAAERPCPWH